ncbi:glycoside hydrolase family 78 protein [Halobacteria archaeon AArc-m2/3/4]|uniref:alpha-L-rhamnosidase n=1 Tax=Natronoglomus mannanivorans TaxID=2979990 RepID=A0ABT2QKM7_9EURY|nr:glycoside hydrolase family 78 protein [Halobacteria archaeon AArc-m2/3/4]
MIDRTHGFGFPEGYRIEVAEDPAFENATTVVDVAGGTRNNPIADPIDHDADVSGRFVRVTFTDLYTFDPTSPPVSPVSYRKPDLVREEMSTWQMAALAALAVRDETGVDLARGRPVTASSSIETATWGRELLVDGAYRSTTAPGSPLLRTSVELSKPVETARIHVATLGYGELYVNGVRMGEAVLDPAWTQYDERVLYNTYDVSEALKAGENAIGLWLGRGRFSRGNRDWSGFGSPRAICQLNITYEDGTVRRVSTDLSWRSTESPIVENDIYDGERYDARKERSGWSVPGYDADDWDFASEMPAPGGDLVPQRTDPISVVNRLEPVSIRSQDNGYLVDFGQNITGWLDLRIDNPTAGEEIVLRHAEALDEEGALSTTDLRSADATDTYVPRGDDRERYHPRFTYHGFRYAHVEGFPGTLTEDDVQACVVSTSMPERGTFDCSDENVTQIQRNAKWGLRGNAHGIPEDCPQRDERFGWTGDGQITAQAFLYNFDAVRFHRKWMDDHDDTQSEHGYVADTVPAGFGTTPADPTWSVTRVVIPWYLYQHTGDPAHLERHYEGMRRYVDYWFDQCEDGILPEKYANYGDWLAFENTDGRRGKPFDLFTTAFHYQTTRLVGRAAEVLGYDIDAERYSDRAAAIEDAFTAAFFDSDAATYGPGTQSALAIPLFLGLVPDEHVDGVVKTLATKVREDDGKLRSGFLGTRPLIHVLANHGYEDLAYEVVTQPEQPGWMYMVHQGATTMWERWDSDEQVGSGMNSLNHSPFTFVSEWFYRTLAGIDFGDGSVLDRIEVAPTVVEDLEWVEGTLETPLGDLASRWERTDNSLAVTVQIPWNAKACVRIPFEHDGMSVCEGETVLWEDGSRVALPTGVTHVDREDDTLVVNVESGTYRFDILPGRTS